MSYAGKNLGSDEGSGTRSSLMHETKRIVSKLKPKWVIWENVKGALSKKHIHNFHQYINDMDERGYNTYYQVLNSKEFGTPQSRERVFAVSIRKDIDTGYEFPKALPLTRFVQDVLEDEIDEKYYVKQESSDKIINQLKDKIKSKQGCIVSNKCKKFDKAIDVAHTIMARDCKGFGNQQMNAVIVADDTQGFEKDKVRFYTDSVPTIRASGSGLKVVEQGSETE